METSANVRPVYPGDTITQAQAIAFLKRDLDYFVQGVKTLVEVETTSNQFGALVSFAYNCGLESLKDSTLLRLLNAGDYAAAADQFLRWDTAGGQVLEGLLRRRRAERSLFLGQDWRQF